MKKLAASRNRLYVVAFAGGILLIVPAALATVIFRLAASNAQPYGLVTPSVQSHDGMAVLEPRQWVGYRFPLFTHIAIDPELTDGRWDVILYSHDCSHCLNAIPEHIRAARSLPPDGPKRYAFVEVPPYGEIDLFAPHKPWPENISIGRLDDNFDWFVSVPVDIALQDGVVMDVQAGNRSSHRASSIPTHPQPPSRVHP